MVSFLISNPLFNRRFNYLVYLLLLCLPTRWQRGHMIALFSLPIIMPLQLCSSPERATRTNRARKFKQKVCVRYDQTEDVSLIATQFVLILPDIPIDDIARAPVPCSLTIADSPSHVANKAPPEWILLEFMRFVYITRIRREIYLSLIGD